MQVEDLKRVGLLESIFRPKEGGNRKSHSTSGKEEVGKISPERIREEKVLAKEGSDPKIVHFVPTEIYDSRGRLLRLGSDNLSSLSMVL